MNQYFQKNQVIAYYLLTIMVIGIIAVRTNIFYSPDATITTVISLFLIFAVVSLVRSKIENQFVGQHPLLDQPKRQLIFEIVIYVFAGVALFCIEILINEQVYIVASKLFSGVLIMGYFASIDSALKREHDCFLKLNHNQSNIQNTIPVSRRISLFLTTTLLVVILANTLSAYSYMSLDIMNQGKVDETLKNAYLIETLFTLGIVVSLTLRLIHSYSINLQHMFDIQVDALQHIQDGKLEDYVPVLSRDEFGVIAQKTNLVIDELREKEKIRQTLESIVSPDIMHKLMGADSSILKQGEKNTLRFSFVTYVNSLPMQRKIPLKMLFFSSTATLEKLSILLPNITA